VLTSELSSAQPCSGVGVNLSERAKKMRHAEMKLDLRVRIDALVHLCKVGFNSIDVIQLFVLILIIVYHRNQLLKQ
jgi:hypothetical protein